jgi:hypothetical protein
LLFTPDPNGSLPNQQSSDGQLQLHSCFCYQFYEGLETIWIFLW